MDKKVFGKQIAKNIWTSVAAFVGLLLPLAARWGLATWVGLTMDELIYHLTSPIDGTGGGIIEGFLFTALTPSIIIAVILAVILCVITKKKGQEKIKLMKIVRIVICLAALVSAIITAIIFFGKIKLVDYLKGQVDNSTFVQEEYVDPDDVTLTFPEKKRNVIYIYLESMETSYADTANGGAMDVNYIPELTQLSLNNESFNGNSGTLNGGIPLPGATWTMGALMAETSGLPLQVSIKHNGMSSQDTFFSGMTALGDILEEEGYTQCFMIGSKATFGGRDVYFKDHGNYDIYDYYWAVEQGLIDEDYFVFWGLEDEKLFSYAKDQLTNMGDAYNNDGTPFNFTLLTVDTHFEDGYLCDLCGDEFDDQYANVLACSSRQVTEFVEWCQTQDWYDDTTIILSGDHLTMDTDFCGTVDDSYTRKTYTAYINSAVTPEDPDAVREYSTFDDFPTTLAAMGVEIEGNRLGLGVNLFSSEPTLLETYGYEYMADELNRKSLFLEELSGVDEEAAEEAGQTEEKIRMQVDLVDYDVDTKNAKLVLSDCHGLTETTKYFEVHVYPDKESEDYITYTLNFDEEYSGYACDFTLDGYDFTKGKIATYQISTSGKSWKTCTISGSLLMEQTLYELMAGECEGSLHIEASGKWWKYLPPMVKSQLEEMGLDITWSDLKANEQSFSADLTCGEEATYETYDDIYYYDFTGMKFIITDEDGNKVNEILFKTNKLPMKYKYITDEETDE